MKTIDAFSIGHGLDFFFGSTTNLVELLRAISIRRLVVSFSIHRVHCK